MDARQICNDQYWPAGVARALVSHDLGRHALTRTERSETGASLLRCERSMTTRGHRSKARLIICKTEEGIRKKVLRREDRPTRWKKG